MRIRHPGLLWISNRHPDESFESNGVMGVNRSESDQLIIAMIKFENFLIKSWKPNLHSVQCFKQPFNATHEKNWRKSSNFFLLHHLVMRMSVSSSSRRTLGVCLRCVLELQTKWCVGNQSHSRTKQKRQTWFIMSLREFDLMLFKANLHIFNRCSMMACN